MGITAGKQPIETKNTRHKEVSLLATSGVGVEKLSFQKFAEIGLRQDASLQTIFSARVDIFYRNLL
jgi:hypothetical protein